jgi:hypothetical protein
MRWQPVNYVTFSSDNSKAKGEAMLSIRNSLVVIVVIGTLAVCVGKASATVISTEAQNNTGFTLSTADKLAATISGSNIESFVSAELNDGSLSTVDNYNNSAMGSSSVISYEFDTVTNPLGYDISRIETYAGGATDSTWGSRDNQGYAVDLSFVDGTYKTLISKAVWTPAQPVMNDWTQVVHANSDNGILDNGSGVVATGVRAIVFRDFDPNNAYVANVRYHEINVFGTATVAIPEPGSLAILVCGMLGLSAYAWKKRR